MDRSPNAGERPVHGMLQVIPEQLAAVHAGAEFRYGLEHLDEIRSEHRAVLAEHFSDVANWRRPCYEQYRQMGEERLACRGQHIDTARSGRSYSYAQAASDERVACGGKAGPFLMLA